MKSAKHNPEEPSHAAHEPHGHAQQAHIHPPHERDHAGHEATHPAQINHTGHAETHSGHVDHSGHEGLFRQRFWVSVLLSIPVLLYTEMLQHWLGFSAPAFSGDQWIAPLFSAIVFLYGGVPFLQMAVPELRQRRPGMMLLISLAISVSFLYSSAAFLFQLGEGFYWELVTLIDIMLLGHWLEMRSVRQASGSLDEIAKLMPDQAERIAADGSLQVVSAADLQAGDLLLVRPGAGIPADGEVVEGASAVNEALLTGESTPVSKAPGDRVIAGALNGDGSLRVRVSATGEATVLAGIMRLVRQAQQSRSRTQILADRAAGWLFYIALAAALLTGLAWTLAQGFDLAVLERVVTVLVIACPHALGLAIPLVVATSTTLAARHGLLVKDRLALEEARAVDVVAFDKTGTLTQGQMGVAAIQAFGDWDETEALALAAAVEGDSEHPLAAAIRQAAVDRGLSLPAVSAFEVIKGQGVRALSDGRPVYLGGPRLLQHLKLAVPPELQEFAQHAGAKAQSVIYLVANGELAAAFSLADVIRPQSAEVVRRLHALGVQVAMITGDSQEVAQAVGAELGIDHIFAEVLPEHKEHKVAELQAQGRRVAMVGDGVNDAPALARANVGIAIGSGTDVAVESAGIILVNSNPVDVLKVFELSRATYRKMIENLAWATGYNLVAIPLAAGALAWAGILLSPAMGAVLMSVSTVIVAINAQLLRRVRLGAI